MKKTFTLLVSAAFAVSAFAVQPQVSQAVSANQSINAQVVKVSEATIANQAQAVKAQLPVVKTDGESLYAHVYGPMATTFYAGLDAGLYGLNSAIGFTPAAGYTTFYNLTSGSTAQEWTWTVNGEDASTSTANELSLKNIPGWQYYDVNMTVTNGTATSQWTPQASAYLCAGNNSYWGLKAEYGMTTYPGIHGGTRVSYMCYDPAQSEDGFAANGLYTGWNELFAELYEVEEDQVTDVTFESFGQFIPKQASPYLVSTLWTWIKGSVSEDTELYVNFYPTNEDGVIDFSAPIAKGTAIVAAGEFSGCIEYSVLPVDEDGDELDEELVVNTGIFIAFEGLDENKAVQQFWPIYGANTSFPVGVRRSDVFFDNSYIRIAYKVDGEQKYWLDTCPYNYFEDDARTTLFGPCNFYVMMDVTFPFVQNINDEQNTSNYYVMEVPTDGGSVDIDLTSLYRLDAMIENGWLAQEQDGDWFDIELSNFDDSNWVTTFTITAPALDGDKGRNGFVNFTGMAQDFTIEVVQGMESGIQDVTAAATGATEYFDLQGRKLNAAPANGFFFERQGNKVTKVIR